MPLSIDSLGSSFVSGFGDDDSLNAQDRTSLLGDFEKSGPASTGEAVGVLKSLGADVQPLLQPDLPIATSDTFEGSDTRAEAARRLGAASSNFDVTEVGVALANKKGGADKAVGMTALMREDGVTPDDPVYKKGMAEIRSITGRDLNPTELRDLDHFLTSYAYVQGDGPAKPEDDNYLKRMGRAGMAEGRAAVMTAASVAYSGLKGASQVTNDVVQKIAPGAPQTDFVKLLTGGTENALGPNTSKASVSEAWQGIKGALNGLKDVK